MTITGRVHLDDGSGKPYCRSTLAERRSPSHAKVTCPFCSALYLADHPELKPGGSPS